MAAVHIPTTERDRIKQEKIQNYFDSYIETLFGIKVYRDYSNKFLEELQIKWKEFKNKNPIKEKL